MKQYINLLFLIVGFTSCQTTNVERGHAGDIGQASSSCGQLVLKSIQKSNENARADNVVYSTEGSPEVSVLEPEKFTEEPINADITVVAKKIDLKSDQRANNYEKVQQLGKKAKLPLKNYQGKNKAMKYGLKMLVYGLIIFPISLFAVDALFWSGEDWTILPFFVFLVLLIVSAVSIVLGLLLFFFGWIVSLFKKNKLHHAKITTV